MNDFWDHWKNSFVVPACLPATPFKDNFSSFSFFVAFQPHRFVVLLNVEPAYFIDCYKMTMKGIFMIINKNHHLLLDVVHEYLEWYGSLRGY